MGMGCKGEISWAWGNCRFVNHMLHKREKEREPHEEISTREGA